MAGLIERVERVVPIDHVTPNPRNYKPMTPDQFAREVALIEKYGFLIPIPCRAVKFIANTPDDLEASAWEIIDGEHRWRALKQLGRTEIAINDFGVVSDREAAKLMIILNEQHAEPQYDQLGKLIADLAAEADGIGDLLAELPFPEAEVRALAVLPFDPVPPDPDASPAPVGSPKLQLEFGSKEALSDVRLVLRQRGLPGELSGDALHRLLGPPAAKPPKLAPPKKGARR